MSQAQGYYPDLRVTDKTILKRPAQFFTFAIGPTGEIPKLDVSELHVIVGDTEWVLTLANLAGLREDYLPEFDRMLASFDVGSQ